MRAGRRERQFDAATTFVNEARNSRRNRRIAEVEGWHEGDSALQVALDRAASSFGRERIPVGEAAAVLRSLAGEKVQLLALVARAKLEDHRLRSYADQVTEMYAAAALLLAGVAPSLTAARPLRAV